MGKIVRGAKLVDRRYVVAVPEITHQQQQRAARELDVHFAASEEFEDVVGAPVFADNPFLPPEAREPEIDWEQVRADSQALIDRAATDGESMLQDAARRARELLNDAQSRVAQIEADARLRGHDEGVAAGRVAAQAEMGESVAAMHDLVKSAREERRTIVESAEPELVRLAMAIAERIVHEQIAIDPNVVVEGVRHALMRLIGREVVTLRVNPADLDVIRQHRESLSSGGDVEHLRVVEDQRIDRGGVVVETEAGTIDAKISTQLREARRAIVNADSVAMSTSYEDSLAQAPAAAS
jgi:flagellar assembly protein FliH